MFTWRSIPRVSLPFWLGSMAVCAMLATTGRAAVFSGEFAPSNWTLTAESSDQLIWAPTISTALSATLYAPNRAGVSSTELTLAPISGNYRVWFRTTFNAMSADPASAALSYGDLNNPTQVALGDNSALQPVVNNHTFILSAGEQVKFLLDSTFPSPDKDNLPWLMIDQFEVMAIPEASTWFAGLGLLAMCGLHYWRQTRTFAGQRPVTA